MYNENQLYSAVCCSKKVSKSSKTRTASKAKTSFEARRGGRYSIYFRPLIIILLIFKGFSKLYLRYPQTFGSLLIFSLNLPVQIRGPRIY